MRNPKWHRDEIILALDLYFSEDRGTIDSNNPQINELSKILNSLPLFPNRPDEEKFRNANGAALKLSNFLAFDPTYKGKGMRSGSKLDGIVFKEFYKNRDRLRSIANEIKKASMIVEIKDKIYTVEDDEQTITDSVIEGQVLYKLHKVRERNIEIVRAKKKQVQDKEGKLECEACIFEFEEFYGDIGKGYIECHHRTPLYTLKVEAKTTLEDLALVCSNCHRMLHRSAHYLSVEDLRTRISYGR